MFQAVCFDFDYTLGDATEAIVAGFTHAFTCMGRPVPGREEVRGTVGMMLEGADKATCDKLAGLLAAKHLI